MAEFIPLDYRMNIATRQRLGRWMVISTLVLACCVAALSSAYALERRSAAELQELKDQVQSRASLVSRSQMLQAKRQELADRMTKIQRLMNDRLLVSMLKDFAQGITANDRLEFIKIDLAPLTKPPESNKEPPVLARISGITSNSGTLAELMTRLTKQSNQQVEFRLQHSQRTAFLDGQVMRFELVCSKPQTPQS